MLPARGRWYSPSTVAGVAAAATASDSRRFALAAGVAGSAAFLSMYSASAEGMEEEDAPVEDEGSSTEHDDRYGVHLR